MDKLTCGERVVRCLFGEPIDRVPFGVGIGWAPWEGAIVRWRKESGNPDLDIASYFGFDASFAFPPINTNFNPPFEYKVFEETENFIVFQDWQGIVKRDRKNGVTMPEFLDYPVKNWDDWVRIKEERLRIDDLKRAPDLNDFASHVKASGEAVQVGEYPDGIFGRPRDLMGAEELMLALYGDPRLVRDMMEHLTTLWISVWEKVAKQVQVDHLHIWEDMSYKQGSLISPNMVREFMMPCYDRIVAFGKSIGSRILSVDTDGDCSQLVPIFMEHGINMMYPFEVQAGNDVREYRKQYPELGIMGGLDKSALAKTKAHVDAEIRKATEMVEKGRYIPGFDHMIPSDVTWEHLSYAAQEIKKICYGEYGA